MPLESFFKDQLDHLRAFMAHPKEVVRILLVDPEMRGVLLRMLRGLDDDDAFPHVLVGHSDPFVDPVTWFGALHDLLEQQLEAHGAELASLNVVFGQPLKDPAARGPWPFLLRTEGIAQSLPDSVGNLVFVLDPETVDDSEAFARSIVFLADKVRTPRLKFIVLDERLAPRLDHLVAETPRTGSQTFWCSPSELESRLQAKLAASLGAGIEERRRTLAMAASVAFSVRNYAKAEAFHRMALDEARLHGTPNDQAVGLYGLGSALLAGRQPEAAAEAFMQGCQLCSEHKLNEVAPMLYANLGIALHRLGNFDQAFASLRVASSFFRAQGNRPGEAFVCDNLALMHQELGRPEEAAKVWRYALQLYEGITSPFMADVRDAGRTDILTKLARLGGMADAA
jgi:tetratricopeptide (TPR) repeat protein